MNTIKRFLYICIKLFYRCLYYFIPVNQKMIVFLSFHGKGYSDNPRALLEYLLTLEEYKDYQFVYCLKNVKNYDFNVERTKFIGYPTFMTLIYFMRSKYWFVNCKLPDFFIKKPTQIYLQTWHGTPLKRLAHDIIVPEGTTFYRSNMSAKEMHSTYDKDVKKYNYMISPSRFTTEVFQSAFQIPKDKLIETGYPRNDILSHVDDALIHQYKEELNLPFDKKIILYAPTWRDNSFNMKGYTFTLDVDFSKWKDILSDEYIIIFKPHYSIITQFDLNDYEGFVYSIDATEDIRKLYIVSDILITDYSSVFFDYAILDRPMYFYMYDLINYKNDLRGFYLDIYKDLPGPIIEDEEELLNTIKNNDYDYSKLKTFHERFNNKEDGHASERVIDLVLGGER